MEVLSVTVDKAAEATGLSRETIRRKIGNGELEVKRVGRRVLVDYQSLARLVSTRANERANDQRHRAPKQAAATA